MPFEQSGSGVKQFMKEKFANFKGLVGKTEWDTPVLQSDETRNETKGELIYTGRKMVNAMPLTGKKWLSEEGRYFPEEAYFKMGALNYLKSKKGDVELKPGTKRYYEANVRAGLGKIRRTPKAKPVHAADRIKEADRLQSLRDQNFTLDLSEYQRLLADPLTNETATEELRTIKALIEDAAKTDLAILEKKLETTKLASSGIGLIGTALGAAAGLTSLGMIAQKASNVATGATQQALKLTESVVDKVGKTEAIMTTVGVLAGMQGIKTQANLDEEQKRKLQQNAKKIAAKTAYAVAMKTASLVLLGVAANLTPAGGTVTALAIVTTVVKGALNVRAAKLEEKGMAIQMNKKELLKTIDDMIENNGTIFYREDNPMFQKSKVLVEKIETILNTQENYKVFDEVAALNNSVTAAALLNDMMTNADNVGQNLKFEQELNSLKTLEKANNATLDRLRKSSTQQEFEKELKILKEGNKINNATMKRLRNSRTKLSFEHELETLKTMEKANNATLQKLRNRREKLKRLYNTYKKPLLAQNIKETANANANTKNTNQTGGKTRRRRR